MNDGTIRENAVDDRNAPGKPRTENLIDEFNWFFAGKASAFVKDDRLIITIGSQTMIIQLPRIVGGESMGPSNSFSDMHKPG